MTTGITRKELLRIYKIPKTRFYEYFSPHIEEVNKRANTTKLKNGKIKRSYILNTQQIDYIVYQVLKGDMPEGLLWNGNEFVPR